MQLWRSHKSTTRRFQRQRTRQCAPRPKCASLHAHKEKLQKLTEMSSNLQVSDLFKALCFQTFRLTTKAKNASSIQYSYKKCGTHERVFFRIFAHEDIKNEMRQKEANIKERIWKEVKLTQKNVPKAQLQLGPFWVAISEAVDKLPNLTLHL